MIPRYSIEGMFVLLVVDALSSESLGRVSGGMDRFAKFAVVFFWA